MATKRSPAAPATPKRTASRKTAPLRTPRAAAAPKPRTTPKKQAEVQAAIDAAAPTATKQSRLIALLKTPAGASIDEMTALTGWQAHTVRGTISGVLRKKLGLAVQCTPDDASVRRYRIVGTAGAA